MCCKYYTISEYIDSAVNTAQRIQLIDELIDKMLLSQLEALDGKDVTVAEYQMNDGQAFVRTRYRSSADLEADIASLEKLKQTYINRLNGRVFLLRNQKGRR